MHKFVLLFLLFLSSTLINSCTVCSCKKMPCPAFNDAYFDQWMGNFSDKKVTYRNSNLVSDTFTLSHADSSIDKEANKGCLEGSNECSSLFQTRSFELTPSGSIKFQLFYHSNTGWDGVSNKQITIQVRNFSVMASNVYDTGFVFHTNGIHTAYIPAITLRSKIYSNVQMIQADTNVKVPGVYKIYLSKNSGLVAYEEYPTHELWIRE
jgi:hypothetical protein